MVRTSPGRALILAAVLVLAGCMGGGPASTPAETDTPSGTATPSDAPATPTSTPTATPTPTPTPVPNPWAKETLTVGIETDVNESRDFAPLVQEALDYWNEHNADYATYPAQFELDADASSPDILVRIQEEMRSCGRSYSNDHVGCADTLTQDDDVTPPARIDIEAGWDDPSTVTILKHEFGHLQGIAHGEAPMPLMNDTLPDIQRFPQPDLSAREWPWEDEETPRLTYYVASDEGEQLTETERQQVAHAIDYFREGADRSLAEDVTFVEAERAEYADVVIYVSHQEGICGAEFEGGSCISTDRLDTDRDGAPEFYDGASVMTAAADEDAVGWHVAYHLATLVGLTGEDRPDVLSPDASFAERRTEWWE